jgi:glycosyltransferase involved in cell wall biosynthesis
MVAGVNSETASDAVEALVAKNVNVCSVTMPPRRRLSEGRRVIEAAVSREPYVLFRRHDRPQMRDAVRRAIREHQPDIVYLDHLDSTVFIDELGSTRFVVDLHNIYSLIAMRAADEQRSWPRRAYLRREASLLSRMEHRAVTRAESVFAVSELERRYYDSIGGHTVLVPNGVHCDSYASLETGRSTADPIVLYVGAMSWTPNAVAAAFLAQQVLPKLRAEVSTARLQIIGKDPPPSLGALHGANGVEVLGAVPDVRPYLQQAAALAVPLGTGGGTRLKILEAFAAGLPVVSTPVGSEGLACESERHLLVADREDFAANLCRVLRDRALGVRLALEARSLARLTYDWSVIVEAAAGAIS